MESQTAYKMLFTDYPDVVNVKQMCEMLGGICDGAGRFRKHGPYTATPISAKPYSTLSNLV